ncbi:hypothetical protein NMG60_11019664 [Bertholletia excelsa]
MSVFGGDSWAREAQYRKRRVNDLVVESLDPSSYRKLAGGKYACLVCPHNPVLDTPLMLSMHVRGSRHRAAKSRHNDRQLTIQDEIDKRVALSECSTETGGVSSSTQVSRNCGSGRKPLIEQTRKAASEILCYRTPQQNEAKGNSDVESIKRQGQQFEDGPSKSNNKGSFLASEAFSELVAQQQLELPERQERELKFTAAGWKRDGHGKWYRDENVEFDSDEEDPNICLA